MPKNCAEFARSRAKNMQIYTEIRAITQVGHLVDSVKTAHSEIPAIPVYGGFSAAVYRSGRGLAHSCAYLDRISPRKATQPLTR